MVKTFTMLGRTFAECSLKKKVVWGMALAFVLLFWGGLAWATKEVVLSVDGEEHAVKTMKFSVRTLLEEQGIKPGADDLVEPALAAPLREGMAITFIHAFPVEIKADGQLAAVKMAKGTVADALDVAGVKLGEMDRVNPLANASLVPGIKVVVTRVTWEFREEEQALAYNTIRNQDASIARGLTRVARSGQTGRERLRYRVWLEDGIEVRREMVNRQVVKEPVARILTVGTMQEVSRNGEGIRFSRALEVEATAYSGGGLTKTATVPGLGTIAVDPGVIALGTRLYIEGYGYGIAQDVGSAIKGNIIDLYMESEYQARLWGRRKVKVYILQ